MKKILIFIFGLLLLPAFALAAQKVVEVEVQGMTCPYCVYGVKKQLEKLPGVEKAQASLELKKARITLAPDAVLDENAVRKAITDAGFTPGKFNIQEK